MNKKLTPYQRIMRASRRMKGMYLSPREVVALSMDTAIVHRAELDDSNTEDPGWHDARAYEQRVGEKLEAQRP